MCKHLFLTVVNGLAGVNVTFRCVVRVVVIGTVLRTARSKQTRSSKLKPSKADGNDTVSNSCTLFSVVCSATGLWPLFSQFTRTNKDLASKVLIFMAKN